MEVKSKEARTEYTTRPPIVTVMGHVDHGKTSILDVIRNTNVQENEYGGITQHIGAYQIDFNSHKITFIDTPGHAAFTQMRARGGKAADIIILVVAANEGVMPQTKEAIAHAKNAGVPIIVAINKVDLPDSDITKTKQGLANAGILTEDWGGDIICIEVSAKNKTNIDKLLEAILAIAELQNLKADPTGELEAIIIESKLDKKRGVIASCIIKNGTLKVGDKVAVSGYTANIRSLTTDKGNFIQKAFPSDPVEVLGFKSVPNVGDTMLKAGSELIQLAENQTKVEIFGKNTKKTVSAILKADTQGTLEAIKASLANMVTSSVDATFSLKFVHCATGDINESDVMLAQNTNGFILGFNIKINPLTKELAETQSVPVKIYKTIYDMIDEVKGLLEGTASIEESKIKGRAQILKVFKLESGDQIAGCQVVAGRLKEGSRIAIYDKNPADITKDDEPLYIGFIKKLKRGKDEVPLVGKDTECGLLLKPQYDNLQKDQWLEVQ